MALDISAETLYRKSNLSVVNTQIDEIYKTIRHKIHEAHQVGAAEIYFDLPDTFQAGNLEPADIQLIVYSRLIEKIENQGLKVWLIKDDNGSMLHIKWPSVLDPAEKKRMKEIIIKHLKQK